MTARTACVPQTNPLLADGACLVWRSSTGMSCAIAFGVGTGCIMKETPTSAFRRTPPVPGPTRERVVRVEGGHIAERMAIVSKGRTPAVPSSVEG